jgi:hypothetical protein
MTCPLSSIYRRAKFMKILDYRNCFTLNHSARDGVAKNICRTQLLAKCTLTNRQTSESFDYFLGKECIGEHMYLDIGIAQVPTSEVAVIFNPNETSLQKQFVDHDNDVVQSGPFSAKRKGFDDGYSYSTELQFILDGAEGTSLTTPQGISKAMMKGKPMVGRTTLDGEESGWSAVLEYPLAYMNVQPDFEVFQVDMGPILYPDFDSTAEMLVDRLQFAYIMYNRFDEAEFAIRVPTKVAEDESAETLHYSKVVKVSAMNELFTLTV